MEEFSIGLVAFITGCFLGGIVIASAYDGFARRAVYCGATAASEYPVDEAIRHCEKLLDVAEEK